MASSNSTSPVSLQDPTLNPTPTLLKPTPVMGKVSQASTPILQSPLPAPSPSLTTRDIQSVNSAFQTVPRPGPLYLEIKAEPAAGNTVTGEIFWKGELYEFETHNLVFQNQDLLKKTIEQFLERLDGQANTTKVIHCGIPELILTFEKDGIRAKNPHASDPAQQIKMQDRAVVELSNAVRVGDERDVELSLSKLSPEKLPVKQLPSAKALEIHRPTDSTPPSSNRPPFLTYQNNSCFLDTFIWTHLLADPKNAQKKLEAAVQRWEKSVSETEKLVNATTDPQTRKTIETAHVSNQNKLKAAQSFLHFVNQASQNSNGSIDPKEVETLRQALHLLNPVEFAKDDKNPHDVAELHSLFYELILDENDATLPKLTRNYTHPATGKPTQKQTIPFPGKLELAISTEEDDSSQELHLQELLLESLETSQLSAYPEEMTLSLARWDAYRRKVTKDVQVPFTLTLPKKSDLESDETYELISADFHIGNSLRSGHFTSLVRTPNAQGKMQNWYCDDLRGSTIQEYDDENALNCLKYAYNLRYRKVSSVPKVDPAAAPAPQEPPKPPQPAPAKIILTEA